MARERKQWIELDQGYFLSSHVLSIVDKIEPAIYELGGSRGDDLILIRTGNGFSLPKKVYDLQSKFIDRCVDAFNDSDKNVGVILYGPKGTGKTVTAEQIAMRLNMPIILITSKSREHLYSLTYLQQPCIILIDEADKLLVRYTSEKDAGIKSTILSLLDGVLAPDNKLLFLLTANELFDLDPLLIDRPGRIRYTKSFKGLENATILEVINDLLNPLLNTEEYIADLIQTLTKLDIVTIDILSSIIKECNLFKVRFSELFEDLNIGNSTSSKITYEVSIVNLNTKESLSFTCSHIYPAMPFDTNLKGFNIEFDGESYGKIERILSDRQFILKDSDNVEKVVSIESRLYKNSKISKILGL